MKEWMKCIKLLRKHPNAVFWRSMKCTRFVMDEMYEIAQQAKCRILGIDEIYNYKRDG